MSDPVLYPAPAGTVEARRQDVARSRRELADTVGVLADRFDVRAAARRRASASASAAIPVAGAVAAGAAAYLVSRWTRLGRLPRAALAATASTLTYRAIARMPHDDQPVRDPAPPSGTDRPAEPVALTPSPHGGDVIDVLLNQHRQVRLLFDRVAAADDGTDRRELFAALVTTLHRHETAEQEIVHPALREIDGADAAVAEERLREEATADRALAALISRGTDDRHFGRDLAELRALVEAHAAAEEADEFPLVRAHLPVEQLQRMANQVRAAQAESW
ncbi:MAG TPA: hemerythrin domain-containing protein [Micromonosporaceae bacterium]